MSKKVNHPLKCVKCGKFTPYPYHTLDLLNDPELKFFIEQTHLCNKCLQEPIIIEPPTQFNFMSVKNMKKSLKKLKK